MSSSMSSRTAILQQKLERRKNEANKKEKLISEVEKRPAIWDKRLEDHRNRNLIDILWNEVADAMKNSVSSKEECKRLWKNLADHFRNVNAYVMNRESGRDPLDVEDEMKAVKWAHFQQLRFLTDVSQQRQTSSNIPVIGTNGNQDREDLNFETAIKTETEMHALGIDSFDEGFSPSGSQLPVAENSLPSYHCASPVSLEMTFETPPLSSRLPTMHQRRGRNKGLPGPHQAFAPLIDHLRNFTTELQKPEDDITKFSEYLVTIVREVPQGLQRQCKATLINVANTFADSIIPTIIIPDPLIE